MGKDQAFLSDKN